MRSKKDWLSDEIGEGAERHIGGRQEVYHLMRSHREGLSTMGGVVGWRGTRNNKLIQIYHAETSAPFSATVKGIYRMMLTLY
jgi:hypothetical protein